MIDLTGLYEPPATLDETIQRRAEWSPATRSPGLAPFLLTATVRTLERAALLAMQRDAFGLDTLDTTITNAPREDEEAA